MSMWRQALTTAAVLTLGVQLRGTALADPIPAGRKASNMKPIGYSGLNGRGGAFKIAVKHAGDRWWHDLFPHPGAPLCPSREIAASRNICCEPYAANVVGGGARP